jgi:O-antigen ligase/polysaccharide polymerase Wzy-like membrane protein
VLALSALVGFICAVINTGAIGGFPPRPKTGTLELAAATAHVQVDLPASSESLSRSKAETWDLPTLVKRAELLSRFMVGPPVLDRIAQRCSLPADKMSGLGRITANVPIALTEPDSERRASEIQASRAPYRLEVQGRQMTPIIDLYVMAPTTAAATCIANSATPALRDYLTALANANPTSPDQVPNLLQLGPARGGVVSGKGAMLTIGMLTFLTMFGLTSALLLGASALQRRRLAARSPERAPAAPAPVEEGPAADDWPHTTRLLPWMLAVFIGVLWLTPFNSIQLNMSAPIELRLDRLILPVVALIWLLAIAAGGRFAPRLRMTWIHVALGALLLTAFLSVVLDARYLNQTQELQLSIKKLPLILSYVSLFVIAASAVRLTEVRPYMKYTLILAVICALEMVYEYRMKQNLFYNWSDKLLPGFFSVGGQMDAGAVDHLGRRVVRGPADVPLEAVAMLTMALPIAVVGIIGTQRWRHRILYALAICALVAAMFATYRKSALIAPVSVILTLLYFRRRELLRLAPLGLVLLIIVSSISPGAIGSTISQFTRSDRASVPTVNDRASDYDAVRPDVWSHLAFGRGWGSYNHDSYRILDSEILTRTIEGGVIGLVAFLLVGFTVVACTRKTIAARDPTSAPVALIGASIAVGFLVLATLFDELSFPHAPYIFLYMVGLVAVVIERRGGRAAPEEAAAELPEPAFDDDLVEEREPAGELVAQAPLVPLR